MATEKALAISGRISYTPADKATQSIPAPQVFAAPAGSVYYLECPATFLQSIYISFHPYTRAGRPKRATY